MPPIDFLIITALEEEREAVMAQFPNFKKLDKENDEPYTYYFTQVETLRDDKSIYQVVLTTLINMGPMNATALAVGAVNKWKPKYVILTGIACGIPHETDYGDVLISTQVADYSLGKQNSNDLREIRWDVYPSGASLLDSSNNIGTGWTSKIQIARPAPGEPVKRKGVVASGGDVISDDDIIESYSKSWPKLIGIEMESGGIAGGIHQTPEQPEFLMIKGVSDFGKDKHNENVKTWRPYAASVAAAFSAALIKSGPGKANIYVKEKVSEEAKRAQDAERRWNYIQNHSFTGFELSVYLKSPVGSTWLTNLFPDIGISFSRNQSSVSLDNVFRDSITPNTSERRYKGKKPVASFWEFYDNNENEKYWVKRITKKGFSGDLVGGFDIDIPWSYFREFKLQTLSDVSSAELNICFPPKIFSAGIEEITVGLSGETFSFDLDMSEESPLEIYHSMASTFYSFKDDAGTPMNCCFGFDGVNLLNKFHDMSMPDYKRGGKRKSIFSGIGGADGGIYFSPSIPDSFRKSEEAKAYSFTIPGSPDFEKIEKQLLEKLSSDNVDTNDYIALAMFYEHQHRWLDTIELITQNQHKVSINDDLNGLLGFAYLRLGRYGDAIKTLKNINANHPKSATIATNLALGYLNTQRPKDALTQSRLALDIEPQNATAYYYSGVALSQLNEFDAAETTFIQALEIEPAENYFVALARLLLYIQKWDRAAEHVKAGLKRHKNSGELLSFLSLLELNDGNLEQAKKIAKKALKFDPQNDLADKVIHDKIIKSTE